MTEKEIKCVLVTRPRLTYIELLDQMQLYLRKHPELRTSVVLGANLTDDQSSICDGALAFDLYLPDANEEGTLTIVPNSVVNPQ